MTGQPQLAIGAIPRRSWSGFPGNRVLLRNRTRRLPACTAGGIRAVARIRC